MVTELNNPTTVLVAPPATAEDFGDSLRWKAGPLLGGLDWLLEQLTGTSAIASLVEPLSGDWVGLSRGQGAWQQAQAASAMVAENYKTAAGQVDWGGDASDAFRERIESVGDTFDQYGQGCEAMAEVTGAMVDLCKATAEAITSILGFIGDLLTRLAVQAAVPVLGWATGAIDGAVSTGVLIDKIRKGIQLIQKAVDFVERFRSVIQAITRVATVLRQIATALTRVREVQTVSSAGAATSTAFGVT